jgi:hypothetical protein
MNIRIIAALRTAAVLATVVVASLAVHLIVTYFSVQEIGTAMIVILLGFLVNMVYDTNLRELQRKQRLDKTVDH